MPRLFVLLVCLLTAAPAMAWSPDGTRVPDTSSILDDHGATWTLGSGGAVLRNGASTGRTASRILFYGFRIYAFDGSWWRSEGGSSWSAFGTIPPIFQSPEGATADLTRSLVDNHGNVWTVTGWNTIVRNGVVTGGYGSPVLFSADRIYALADGWWWRWEGGTYWTAYSTQNPTTIRPTPPGTPSPTGTLASAADAFVDTIGVNTHFDVNWSVYVTRWDAVSNMLVNSGIRHIREGMVDATQLYYDRLYSLYSRAGIRNLVHVGKWANLNATIERAQDRMPQVEAFEGLNEWDLFGGPNWVADLRAYQQQLYAAVKSSPRRSTLPVLTPSVISFESSQALGDLSNVSDRGNLHNYYSARHPGTTGWGDNGYGSLARNVEVNRLIAGNLNIWSTETGYGTGFLQHNRAPDAVVARYLPRLLFCHFAAGIGRTYLYQFSDEEASDDFATFGLIRTDGSAKPGYNAIRNLIALLRDPGAAFTPTRLDYAVTNVANLRQVLLQKRDGTFLLALWREVEDYSPTDGTMPAVVDVPLTLSFRDGVARQVTEIAFNDDGNTTTRALARGAQATTSVSSRLRIFRIQP